MPKLNPQNERIKRDYLRFPKEALGKSEVGFKDRLTERCETLSRSTQASALAALKEFFTWLAWQAGLKSRIHALDIDYFSPSNNDLATTKAAKLRDYPSLEQVRAVIVAMPSNTVIHRRNRALIVIAILTGTRDRAMVSLSLRHVDLSKSPPLVKQEPDRVETKFAKSINTYFFRWAAILRTSSFIGSTNCKRTTNSDRTIRSFRKLRSCRTTTNLSTRRGLKPAIGATRRPCGRFSGGPSRTRAFRTSHRRFATLWGI
jgi:integrase